MASNVVYLKIEELMGTFVSCLASHQTPENIEMYTNKELLIQKFEEARLSPEASKVEFAKDICSAARHPSNFSPLVSIQLEEKHLVYIETLMKFADQVLIGKIFLGRVIVPPIQMSAIQLLVEDPKGQRAVRLSIYNYHEPITAFPVGTIVGIINPYFKTAFDGGLCLRTDDPKDVLILSNELVSSSFPNIKWCADKNSSTASKDEESLKDKVIRLRKEGNKFFGMRNYILANAYYSKGLACAPDDEDLLSNQSACYLKMENYRSALDNALLCLKKNPSHLKAVYRAAKAYNGLKDYEEAENLLRIKLNLDGGNGELQKLLKETQKFICQKDFGKYDMPKIVASWQSHVNHEIANYMGPVEVAKVKGKGLGLRVTRNVVAGELLVCSQAYAYILISLNDILEENAKFTTEGQWQFEKMINVVVEKLIRHPESGMELYQLWAGRKLGRLDTIKDDCTKVDRERINAICIINSFATVHTNGSLSLGLWTIPSYINNDCVNANAVHFLYGNVCQIKSVKPIKFGEEILISYCKPMFSSLELRTKFFLIKEFCCTCSICKFERQEPIAKRLVREKLYLKTHDDHFKTPQQIKMAIENIKVLSLDSPFIENYLAPLHLELGDIYYENKHYKNAIDAYTSFVEKCQRFIKGDFIRMLMKPLARIMEMYVEMDDINNAKKWSIVLKEHAKIIFGSADPEILNAYSANLGFAVESLSILDDHF